MLFKFGARDVEAFSALNRDREGVSGHFVTLTNFIGPNMEGLLRVIVSKRR